ncbi:MAG: A/G-specific adenine glycosylase, partial [Bacteroidales bacterium]
ILTIKISLFVDSMEFKDILIEWYGKNGRDLPWRRTSNPYHIWVSEVILQQTRVNQGMAYYSRFIEQFPTIQDLANASLDQVMKAWQGLGYYTRARNLKAGAQQVMDEYGGELPKTFRELLKIKGLGTYSAAAVASFAFGEAVPAIDGNVYRILARVFGIFSSTDTTAARHDFFDLAAELLDKVNPAAFNQAIIDFGALVCTPRIPKCVDCPFNGFCYASRNNLVYSLPVKGKRVVPRDRFFNYVMVKFHGDTFVNRRNTNDIWHSLFEFPMIETPTQLSPDELFSMQEWKDLLGQNDVRILNISDPIKHQLSHLTIWARFIIVEISKASYRLKTDFCRVDIGKLHELSVPRLIDLYMAAEPTEKYFTNAGH